MPLPLAAFVAASTWAAKNVVLSGQVIELALTAIQLLRAPSLWEGAKDILSETEYGELTDLLDWAIDELLTPAEAGMPTGSIILWTGRITATPPDGFLMCNGQEVSRETYADLYTLLGNGWGDGDGVDTFNLPDFRGQFPRGSNPTIGGTGSFDTVELAGYGGEEYHTLTEGEIPAHNHSYTRYSTLDSTAQVGSPNIPNLWRNVTTQNSGNKGGGLKHNNVPPFNAINYLIKY